MIQRIQSVYWLLVVAVLVATMSMPVGMFVGSNGRTLPFMNYGLMNVEQVGRDWSCWGMFALLLVSAIIALATIFLYKNRKLQIRLTRLNIFVMVGWYAVFGVFFTAYGERLAGSSFYPGLSLVFPLVGLVLNVMAIRAVRKDENLVKAADRLR